MKEKIIKYLFNFTRSDYWDLKGALMHIQFDCSENVSPDILNLANRYGIKVTLIIRNLDISQYKGPFKFVSESKGPTELNLLEYLNKPKPKLINPELFDRLEHCLADIQKQLFCKGLLGSHLRISHPYEWGVKDEPNNIINWELIEQGNTDYILTLPRAKDALKFTLEIKIFTKEQKGV